MTDEASPEQSTSQPSLLTIDDTAYEISSIPDEIKVLVNDLIRVDQELAELQYRLRHTQAAQQTYVATIKAELKRLKVRPYQQSTENSDDNPG